MCGARRKQSRTQDARLWQIFDDGWTQFEKTKAKYPIRFLVMRAAAEALGYHEPDEELKRWLAAREKAVPGFLDQIQAGAT